MKRSTSFLVMFSSILLELAILNGLLNQGTYAEWSADQFTYWFFCCFALIPILMFGMGMYFFIVGENC
jgi:hypothetical protein